VPSFTLRSLRAQERHYRRCNRLRVVGKRPVATVIQNDDLRVRKDFLLLRREADRDVRIVGAPDDERRKIKNAKRAGHGLRRG
jgi:hypothetical protein